MWFTRSERSKALCLMSLFPTILSLLCYFSLLLFVSLCTFAQLLPNPHASWCHRQFGAEAVREKENNWPPKSIFMTHQFWEEKDVKSVEQKGNISFVFIHTDIWSLQSTAVLLGFFILQDFCGFLNGYCTWLTHDPLLSFPCMKRWESGLQTVLTITNPVKSI